MKAVHVTALVSQKPDAQGNLTVRLANGGTAKIPASEKNTVMERSARESRTYSPNTVIVGNCGTSQVDLGVKDNDHPVRMTTGFTVDSPAVEYGWTVNITGPNYSYEYTASGFLAADSSWSGSHNSEDDYTAGDYTAAVTTGSYATLVDGTICYSGGPVADVPLTSPDTPIEHDPGWLPPAATGSLRKAALDGPSAGNTGASKGAQPRASAAVTIPTQVPDTTVYPNNAVAYLAAYYADGQLGQCTGFFYSPTTIATVGHCLYNPQHGGWIKQIAVSPGLNSSGAVSGLCLAKSFYSAEGWVLRNDYNYDYGAVSLTDCVWTGAQPGSFTLAPPSHQNDTPPGPVTLVGYTGSLTPSRAQWSGTDAVLDYTQRTFRYNVQSYVGMSGGPVYVTGGSCSSACVAGIQSLGYGPGSVGPSTAVRVTQANFADFNAWANGRTNP